MLSQFLRGTTPYRHKKVNLSGVPQHKVIYRGERRGEGMVKYQIFSANLLENNANKLCTKFGSPMMMETCRNHVPQKQQKREN